MVDIDDIRAPRATPREVSQEDYLEAWTCYESLMLAHGRNPAQTGVVREIAQRLRHILLRVGGVTE